MRACVMIVAWPLAVLYGIVYVLASTSHRRMHP